MAHSPIAVGQRGGLVVAESGDSSPRYGHYS